MWAVELVSGTGEKVAVHFFYVAQNIRCIMHGIDERQRNRMRQLNCAAKIVDRTERVAAGTEGHYFRLLRNQSLEIVPIQLAGFGIHLRDA